MMSDFPGADKNDSRIRECSEEFVNKIKNKSFKNEILQMNIETKIYKRFHIIDDIKLILLHNLGVLNRLQNEYRLFEIDFSENKIFYDYHRKKEFKNEQLEKQIEISTLAARCVEDTERLIIETSIILDLYELLKDKTEMDGLFSEKFVPFIQGISNLESLFLSTLPQIEELLSKIKLFGKTLQKVLHFEIQIETNKDH
jgi:hypothetical protein